MSRKPLRLSARDALVEAAIEAWTEDRACSLSAIAIRAGVGRATLHRYFPTRWELLVAVSEQALRETDEACAPLIERADEISAAEGLHLMFRAVLPLGKRFAFLSDERPREPLLVVHYRKQLDQLVLLAAALKEQGAVPANVPESWIASLIDSLIWTSWMYAEAESTNWDEAAELATRTVLGWSFAPSD